MSNKIGTIFQNLNKTINGGWTQDSNNVNIYNMSKDDTILYRTTSKEDYAKKIAELKQQKYLNNLWRTTNRNLTNENLNGLNAVKMMYRDVELMSEYPEIGAALDIYADEACTVNQNGNTINVYSDSNRIKSIIEDLLNNRLDIQITAPMVIRSLCKYGNQFMLLNIDSNNGIRGWRQMPVTEMERIENGMLNPYVTNNTINNENLEDTSFVWTGAAQQSNYFKNWQIAHFRLLNDSLMLPYGCSILNKARRHWRIMSLMEDMMLIYRLERSIERRVYKIYVGAVDDADVQAYVEDIANNIKRTPLVDPMTGQLDLRKNILDVSQDIFIPVRDAAAPTPIDTLPAAQNLTAIDDIKYIQNKVLAGLRIPKPFLNFEETTGDGKNLALMDVRFARVITRIQQAFLMELTKVVTIHLYLLGFKDELTNFTLTMNNPSTQAEQLEIENMSKKIDCVRNAVSDPGNGIPVMSMTRALKEIMKWSDSEIKDNLEEIRLEKALAAELEKTSQIIKRTKIFDTVDKVYGEPGADYQSDDQGGMNGQMPNGGGGGGLAPSPSGGFGDDLSNLNDVDNNEATGDINGEEGSIDTSNMPQDLQDQGTNTANESTATFFYNKMINKLNNSIKKQALNEGINTNKTLGVNSEFKEILEKINEIEK